MNLLDFYNLSKDHGTDFKLKPLVKYEVNEDLIVFNQELYDKTMSYFKLFENQEHVQLINEFLD